MMDNMSIADAMALRGDNNGFGNGFGGDFFLVILFLFLFGGNGFGQNGFGGAATAAAQQEILLGQQFEGVHNKLDSIGKGICDSTYALNNSITTEGRALQGQIAECCCENRVGLANLNAKIDQQTGIITNMLKDNKIETLQSQVADLRLKDALCGVVRYPTQMAYTTNCNPFFNSPCGYNGYQPNI